MMTPVLVVVVLASLNADGTTPIGPGGGAA